MTGSEIVEDPAAPAPHENEKEKEQPGPDAPPCTVTVGESVAPGLTLEGILYYRSEAWVNAARLDVSGLLFAYLKALDEQSSPTEESPFEVMKRVWHERGWLFVHLLGVNDGFNRSHWAESLSRLFLEHFKPDSDDEAIQAGALFALYLFWVGQPTRMRQIYIRVSSDMLKHIAAFPEALALKLEARPDKLILVEDVRVVVHTLLSRSAFFVVPRQLYAFPSLPSVTVERKTDDTATKYLEELLRYEQEVDALRTNGTGLNNNGTTDTPAIATGSSDAVDWRAELKARQQKYVDVREAAFPLSGAGMDDVEKSVLGRARGMTLKALRDAGQAADTGSSSVPTASASASVQAEGTTTTMSTEPTLFGLVGQQREQSASGGGLHQYEEAITELQRHQQQS